MGGTMWSDAFYKARETARKETKTSAFAHSEALSYGPAEARKVHEKMEPKGVKLRESRDSIAHPESRAIAVLFDVTGSMHSIPVTLQKKLSELMNLLMRKGYVEHPQVLFGAVGDATCDCVPLQIGQFESGIEMDDDLGRMFLEGGGGSDNTESYELAAYFMARHTAMDCWDKRSQKGYLYFIGDERPYDKVKSRELKEVLGVQSDDLPTSEIFAELQAKWEVFCLIPTKASHARDITVKRAWVELLGQNVLQLEDADAVCETIALSIGLMEGKVDLDTGASDLRDMGAEAGAVRTARSALVPLSKSGLVRSGVAAGELAVIGDGGGAARRL